MTVCLCSHQGCPLGWWMLCLERVPRQERPWCATPTCLWSPSRAAHWRPSASRREVPHTASGSRWSWEAKTPPLSLMMPTWASASPPLWGPALPTRCLPTPVAHKPHWQQEGRAQGFVCLCAPAFGSESQIVKVYFRIVFEKVPSRKIWKKFHYSTRRETK